VKVLVVTAVAEEAEAIDRGIKSPDIVIVRGGVGPVAAATMTARALATDDYSHVISAGIAGALPGRANVGDVVVARSTIAADLGCRTDDGFLTLADMGLEQQCQLEFPDASSWRDRLDAADVPAVVGDVLTLSCMTGTDHEAAQLADSHPDAVAEAMEGWGVAWAARSFGVAAGEVRTISNVVGKRDRSTWDIAAAVDALSRAFGVLLAEPL
jgi:futalosine hydrolase